jgi:ribulose 1,5-bisphosphate synthetase/thiazole synthase
MRHSYLLLPHLSILYEIRGVMNNELNELKAPYDVVIVGSGCSGTMVAVHLARTQRGLRLALIDRSKTFGRGA